MNSIEKLLRRVLIRFHLNGGQGSGNFGHAGRPGEQGGSGEGGDEEKGSFKWDQQEAVVSRLNGYVKIYETEGRSKEATAAKEAADLVGKGKFQEAIRVMALAEIHYDIKNTYHEITKARRDEEVHVKYGADWGTKPGTFTAYRSGPITGTSRGNFFAIDPEGAKSYSREDGKDFHKYEVTVKNPYTVSRVEQAYADLTGKSIESVYQEKANKDAQKWWVRIDQQVAKLAREKGYDALVYTDPAPPAMRELVVFDQKGIKVKDDEPKANGGAGSGNFGHEGRPGEVGGSGEGDLSTIHSMKDVPDTAKYKRGALTESETGGKYGWTLNGKALSPSQALQLETDIKAVGMGTALAPGFQDVQFREDFKTARAQICQFTDSKGRTMRVLDKATQNDNDLRKQGRVANMEDDLPVIRTTVDRDARKGVPEAIVVKVIDATAMRIGSTKDTKGDVQAYGASTLLKQHVKVDGNKVTFTFIAKGGEPWVEQMKDPVVARFIQARLQTVKPDQPVLGTRDAKVNDYIQRIPSKTETLYTAHNFRHHHATESAADHMERNYREGMSSKELKALIKDAIQAGADRIHDTPSVARKNYILPSVFEKYL